MWELINSCQPFIVQDGIFERHPMFPKFKATTPLNYTLLSRSCMSVEMENRPTFGDIITVCQSLQHKVNKRLHVDVHGQVSFALSNLLLYLFMVA